MEFRGIGEFLAIAGEALSDAPPKNDALFGGTAQQLGALLSERNGFYALESALHVFPASDAVLSGRSLGEWNNRQLWVEYYGELAPPALFFAEDVFGGQFALMDDAVYLFDPETAKMTVFANSVEEWASRIIAQFDYATGYSIAHAWQVENGALPVGHRLIPRVPFSCGGDFSVENMVLIEAVSAMRYWGGFATMIAGLPDGAQLRFNPAVVDGLRCAGCPRGDRGECRCFDR
ncbi:SMI1/KNR4 family protein [Streptomyces sp. S1D4-11]|nr:SMI1/KNR4 family protein [Streptomyces sp. S1D4-11]QIY96385.1 SMI1/KNR4 family protein [Streptomyces sp. S1D4-11]